MIYFPIIKLTKHSFLIRDTANILKISRIKKNHFSFNSVPYNHQFWSWKVFHNFFQLIQLVVYLFLKEKFSAIKANKLSQNSYWRNENDLFIKKHNFSSPNLNRFFWSPAWSCGRMIKKERSGMGSNQSINQSIKKCFISSILKSKKTFIMNNERMVLI